MKVNKLQFIVTKPRFIAHDTVLCQDLCLYHEPVKFKPILGGFMRNVSPFSPRVVALGTKAGVRFRKKADHHINKKSPPFISYIYKFASYVSSNLH
jgi:hypothetical protein